MSRPSTRIHRGALASSRRGLSSGSLARSLGCRFLLGLLLRGSLLLGLLLRRGLLSGDAGVLVLLERGEVGVQRLRARLSAFDAAVTFFALAVMFVA